MAGHSKWSNIKRRKGAVDAKRGKLFTKLAKEIMVSARLGGGDRDGNPRLRLAINAARAQSMPLDNINRAIAKGTGELEGGQMEELVYEGYGPGGVAFIMDVATDNQTRTIAEVRSLFDKLGGGLGKSGTVAFLFTRRGMIRFDAESYGQERIMNAAIEAGAEDVQIEDDQIVVYTEPNDLSGVRDAIEAAGLEPAVAEITMIPSTSVMCDEELARTTLKLLERLEDHDDIQNVWSNFDIPDAIMDMLDGE